MTRWLDETGAARAPVLLVNGLSTVTPSFLLSHGFSRKYYSEGLFRVCLARLAMSPYLAVGRQSTVSAMHSRASAPSGARAASTPAEASAEATPLARGSSPLRADILIPRP